MFKLLLILGCFLTSEATSAITEGSGVAKSVSETEIEVSWPPILNAGSFKDLYVTARLLGGGGIWANVTVPADAKQCTLGDLLPGYYYSVYLQPVSASSGQLGHNVRIGTFKTLDAREAPVTTALGITCGVVAAVCLVLGVVIIVLKKQGKNRNLDRNIANAQGRESPETEVYERPASSVA